MQLDKSGPAAGNPSAATGPTAGACGYARFRQRVPESVRKALYALAGIFTGNIIYATCHHDLVLAVIGGACWPAAWAVMLITRSVDISVIRDSVAWFFH